MQLIKNTAVYDRDYGQPGIIVPQQGGSEWDMALTANRAYLVRFHISRPMTIALFSFITKVAAGANDACDVGIYTTALARLASAGATTGKLNSTGLKTINLSAAVSLAPGAYYAAFSSGAQGGTAGQILNEGVGSLAPELIGSSAPKLDSLYAAASHPLPTTITPTGTWGERPKMGVRES